MSKKGLSFDQKKEVLLNAILSSGTIHNMQEIESLGRKNKVIPQAIKEVVEALLAERTLCMEKVGTQNIYWAFPSSQKATLLSQLETLTGEVKEATLKREAAEMKKKECFANVKMTDAARLAMREETNRIRKAVEAGKSELARLKKNDPAVVASKLKELKAAKRSCDLWTDNAFILRQRLIEKFGCSVGEVESQFGISENLDYVYIE